jgi:hypothetical protein
MLSPAMSRVDVILCLLSLVTGQALFPCVGHRTFPGVTLELEVLENPAFGFGKPIRVLKRVIRSEFVPVILLGCTCIRWGRPFNYREILAGCRRPFYDLDHIATRWGLV